MAAIYDAKKISYFIGDKELKGVEPYSFENDPIERHWKVPVKCEMTLPNGMRIKGNGRINTETNKIEFPGLEILKLDISKS